MNDGPPNGAVSGQGDGGENWRKSGPGWGNDYGKQGAIGEVGLDKEIDNVSCLTRGRLGRRQLMPQLRYHLNDLVESIRPYGTCNMQSFG
jgi:hypothetical protein